MISAEEKKVFLLPAQPLKNQLEEAYFGESELEKKTAARFQ